jgi:LmbE family N-acetylglucosaminyl deacetylase
MNTPKRAHLALSPHPDDAVWSAGGRIGWWARAGRTVTVVTVFDGPQAGPLPGSWREIAEPGMRRAEDVSAVSCLGAKLVWLALPEAALRSDRGVPRYASQLRLFGPVCPQDRALSLEVAETVLGMLEPGTVLHAPLAAGSHVDHRLVRAAAAALASRGARVSFYEDFPYRLRPADHVGLRPVHAPVDMPSWLRAAACYSSQVRAMFPSAEKFRTALLSRAEEHGRAANRKYADRFWKYEYTI